MNSSDMPTPSVQYTYLLEKMKHFSFRVIKQTSNVKAKKYCSCPSPKNQQQLRENVYVKECVLKEAMTQMGERDECENPQV